MNCMASRTTLTVIMPPNPVLARLLGTVTFPFYFYLKRGSHMFLIWFSRHEKDLEIHALARTDAAIS